MNEKADSPRTENFKSEQIKTNCREETDNLPFVLLAYYFIVSFRKQRDIYLSVTVMWI